MADPNIYFDASFAGVPLLVATLETEEGRDVAIQSPARGDRHVLQDRGRKLLSSTVQIVFCNQAGQDPYLDRFDQFRSIANGGASDIYSHSVIGSYRARIGSFTWRASSDALAIEVNCTILAEDEPTVVFRAGAGVSTQAGLDAVATSVANTNTELAAIGASSSAPQSCLDSVTAWVTGDDLDSQVVFAQVATLTGQIDQAINDLDLVSDLSRWVAYQQMIRLAYEVERAAEAVTSDADHVFTIMVNTARPLLSICAEVYGAELAVDREQRIAKLNRVRAPGLVPAGTTLKMISDGASA